MKFLMMITALAFSITSSMAGTPSLAAGPAFGALEEAAVAQIPNAYDYEAVGAPEHLLFSNKRNKRAESFPSSKVRAYDPVTKTHYQKAIVGKTHKAGMFDSYDYWRYVTVYNVNVTAERIAYLPYFEEDCHDSSFFMAQWGESRSLKVSLSSSLGADVLGLNASVSMSIETGLTFSTARRVQATEGIQARHYPYKLADHHKGVTYIQVYWKDKKKFGYLKKLGGFDRYTEDYPHPFELDNQDVGFKVKREVMNRCPNYNPTKDPVKDSTLYIN